MDKSKDNEKMEKEMWELQTSIISSFFIILIIVSMFKNTLYSNIRIIMGFIIYNSIPLIVKLLFSFKSYIKNRRES